jgi:DNA-binding PadR family transcriptional regulator
MATGDALLALLLTGPRHGYDLKRSYDDWFAGLRPLAFGQVYATLSRLQRDDLVQVAHTETGEGPERVVYELTDRGRGQARQWLADPVEPIGTPADELVRKILAAQRLQADPDGLLSRQRTEHLRRMRSLDAGGELAPALLADHARLHLDADLRWLEIAAERFAAEPTGGTSPAPATRPLYEARPEQDLSQHPDEEPFEPAPPDSRAAAEEGARP